jgi:Mlc titration factor MtfA (ptsG expression regulator)
VNLGSDGAVVALFALLVAAVAVWMALRARSARSARKALLGRKLSESELRTVFAAAPLCKRLPADLRPRWEGLVRLFLSEKVFVGCKGLEVTDDLRLAVAGQACLLLVARPDLDAFPDLSTLYLHPTTYVRRDEWSLEGGASVAEEDVEFDGESWDRGAVVLSAKAVRQSSRKPDGFNVVIHEFAHQFDALDGASDGCPPIPSALRAEWKAVMSAGWEALCQADRRGAWTFLDPYGAESPAEFFAVLVETFFELPGDLKAEHPDLHSLLVRAFGTDPLEW